ncbi:MAG: Uma2 family endonuclease [Isosphaeraceae bacterium]
MATAEALLTAEEFGQRPDPGYPEELVRGRIVPMPMPKPRHGQICGQVVYLLRRSFETNDLGHVLSNDSGVITERDPDTMRGADVCFYSYARVPKGPLPEGYLEVMPELVFEVRSPDDRWRDVTAKVAEYLKAGVPFVVVLDPEPQTANLFAADHPPRVLSADDDLAIPALLGAFQVAVRRFFQ